MPVEIIYQGDPVNIAPRNRRERRVKAALLRARVAKGSARIAPPTLPESPTRPSCGGKLKIR
jgi:hypothetical protein